MVTIPRITAFPFRAVPAGALICLAWFIYYFLSTSWEWNNNREFWLANLCYHKNGFWAIKRISITRRLVRVSDKDNRCQLRWDSCGETTLSETGGLPSMGSCRVGHDWSDLAAAAAYVFMYWKCTCQWLLLYLQFSTSVNIINFRTFLPPPKEASFFSTFTTPTSPNPLSPLPVLGNYDLLSTPVVTHAGPLK